MYSYRPLLALVLLGAVGCEPAALVPVDDAEELNNAERTAQSARPPALTKIDPPLVIAGSEGELTITGRGFVPGLSVTVGGRPALSPRVVNSTKLQAILPPGLAAGSMVPVRVTLADGRSAARSDLFSVLADPLAFNLLQTRARFDVPAARSPAVADFNLDGQPDIAEISATSMLMLQLSNAGGGRTTQTGPAVSMAFNLFPGDIDRDGKVDLVVTTLTSPAGGVLLSNGDGTFQALKPLPASCCSFSPYQHNQVAIADVTGDGKVDLAIGDVGGAVVLLPGNGDGTFATPMNITASPLPQPARAVRFADLDGNGTLEVVAVSGLVSAPFSGTLVTILRQTDGTFKETTRHSLSESLSALALVDYDGDGKSDAVALSASGRLQFFRGNGDGTVRSAAAGGDVGTNGSFLGAAELNGDGAFDFVSGGRFDDFSTGAFTAISLGNGDGTVRSAPLDGSTAYSGGTLADLNKDGRSDLVLTSSANHEVRIFYGNGDGSFGEAEPIGQATTLASGDFNKDGKLDVAYVGATTNKLGILLGNGDGTFAKPRLFDVDKAPSAVTTGDFNGDGRLDAAVSCYDTNLVSLLLGNGDGTFAPQRTFSVGKGANALAAGDLDGDGKLDIVTANTDGDSVSVLIGNGTGNFATNKDYTTGKAPVAVALGDANGDGRLDVFTGNADGNNVAYLQGSAVVAGTLNAARLVAAGSTPTAVVLGDFNGDGKLDALTSNSDSNNLALLAGRGDGTFVAARLSATCEFPSALAAGDLSGDGKADVVVQCAGSRRAQALLGLGDGSFAASPQPLPLGGAVAFADLNADLKLDVLIANNSAPLQVLLNNRK